MNPTNMTAVFSENLRNALAEKGISQSALAKKSDVSQQNISKYCQAKTLPDLGTVVQIAQALEMSVDSLLGLDDPLKAKRQEVFSLSDLLRELVLIADTLNLQVTKSGCAFVETHLGIHKELPQIDIAIFWEKWHKFRTLLCDRDIDFKDYTNLINSRLGEITPYQATKNEFLEESLKIAESQLCSIPKA